MKRRWKADEMEMSINYKSVRASWAFSLAFLCIWNIVNVVQTGELASLACILLTIETLVFLTTKLFLTKKMTDGGDHDE